MSSRRTLILLGAVAIGAVAAFLLFNYVSGIEDRANEDAELVVVFSAQAEILQGTDATQAFDSNLIKEDKIPAKFKPADAIGNIDDIEGKVAILNISEGSVITKAMFVDPVNASVSFRNRLQDPDHVAITISLDNVRSVGGFLTPGDDVNILINATQATSLDANEAAPPPLPDGSTCIPELAYFCGDAINPAFFLYQKVNILAVGNLAQLQPGESTTNEDGTSTTTTNESPGVITFNVPPDAAAVIASVAPENIYLTLVAKEYVPSAEWAVKTNDLRASDLLPGEDPAVLTPYGPNGLEEAD